MSEADTILRELVDVEWAHKKDARFKAAWAAAHAWYVNAQKAPPPAELRQHEYSAEDTIRALRSCLNVVTDALEFVVEEYVPETRGRSYDDKDAHHGWLQQLGQNITNARSAIDRSRDYES
jgi:hypothetical protein